MKSLNAKTDILIFYQFEIFAIKAAEKQRKYEIFQNENWVTSYLKRFYFALLNDGL